MARRLWKERNNFTHRHVCRPPEIVREQVGSLLYKYRKIHSRTEPVSLAPKKLRGHLTPPPAGQLCLSVWMLKFL
ncbi:hypothetical protein PanWU01x14_285250 [Parasponia andersonii]|uniref:Uncharacterized protein n=1 Tax=Parasponia andersonii TaxID=3476 RepID=A0A2P5AZM5_PARAD|nr:hypothetical protein PanWU01x14_285250 [Parasponia andersonii]